MINTLALISICILGAIVFVLIISRNKSTFHKLLLLVYGITLIFESTMMITSKMKINNHFIANIHTLIFASGILLVLNQIRLRLIEQKSKYNLVIITIGFYLLIWSLDNFVIHSITIFNPLSESIIFAVTLGVSIYLLSIILLIENTSLTRRAETLFVIGFLLCSANNVIVDFVFNYYMHLSDETYVLISKIGLCVALTSHFIILLSIIRLNYSFRHFLRFF